MEAYFDFEKSEFESEKSEKSGFVHTFKWEMKFGMQKDEKSPGKVDSVKQTNKIFNAMKVIPSPLQILLHVYHA
jgi:hypothetical protein